MPLLCKQFIVGLVLIQATVCSTYCAEPLWRELFNGRDLAGWKIVGGVGHAWVENGEIRGHMVRGPAEHSLICTEEKFGDFILELDSFQSGGFNSGILFRSQAAPADVKVPLVGYQVKIDPSPTRLWTGGIFSDLGDRWQWFYTLKNDARARAAYKVNAWSHFRIEAIGPVLKVWVNGVPTANLRHTEFANGSIALKIHYLLAGGPAGAEQNTIRFKNIRILTDQPERHALPIDLPTLESDPTEVMRFVNKPAP